MIRVFDEHNTSIWLISIYEPDILSGLDNEILSKLEFKSSEIRAVLNEEVKARVYERKQDIYSVEFCVHTDNVKIIDLVRDSDERFFFKKINEMPPDFKFLMEI